MCLCLAAEAAAAASRWEEINRLAQLNLDEPTSIIWPALSSSSSRRSSQLAAAARARAQIPKAADSKTNSTTLYVPNTSTGLLRL